MDQLTPEQAAAFRKEVMEYFAGQKVLVWVVDPETGMEYAYEAPAEEAFASLEGDC